MKQVQQSSGCVMFNLFLFSIISATHTAQALLTAPQKFPPPFVPRQLTPAEKEKFEKKQNLELEKLELEVNKLKLESDKLYQEIINLSYINDNHLQDYTHTEKFKKTPEGMYQ